MSADQPRPKSALLALFNIRSHLPAYHHRRSLDLHRQQTFPFYNYVDWQKAGSKLKSTLHRSTLHLARVLVCYIILAHILLTIFSFSHDMGHTLSIYETSTGHCCCSKIIILPLLLIFLLLIISSIISSSSSALGSNGKVAQ